MSVVVHHSGRRDVYVLPRGGGEPSAALTLTDAQARTLGAVLSGGYFQPAIVEDIEAVVGDLLIDWVTLHADVTRRRSHHRGPRDPPAHEDDRRRDPARVANRSSRPNPRRSCRPATSSSSIGRQEDLRGFVRHVVG